VFTGAEALAASVVTFKILLVILETLKHGKDIANFLALLSEKLICSHPSQNYVNAYVQNVSSFKSVSETMCEREKKLVISS